LGSVLAPLCAGSTPPVLRLSDATGNVVTIDSTGVATFSGLSSCSGGLTCSTAATYPQVSPGEVKWAGQIGPFNVLLTVGLTKPILPLAIIDVSFQGVQTAGTGGTLTLMWTDINFYGSGFSGITESSNLYGTGSYTFTSYLDASNLPLSTGTLVGTVGPFTGSTQASLAGPIVPSGAFS